MKNTVNTISDNRNQKALMTGEHEAFNRDYKAKRIAEAKRKFLRENPDVGMLIRNGKEVFYKNIEPLHLGMVEEVTF